jgi:hypothetical protein
MTLARLALASLVPGAFILAGCGDDSSTNNGEDAPPLPPAESMEFDFGAFDEPRLSGDCQHFHWFQAAGRVTLINLQVAEWVRAPSLVFAAALAQDPVLQPDESYLWSYTWDDPETTVTPDYTVRLTGRLEGVHVDWELRVSAPGAEPPLENATWFYGQSSIQEASGFWVFIDVSVESRPEVARITWDLEGTERSLAFESIHEQDDNFGDRLTYDANGSSRAVLFFDASDNMNWNISWDRETRAGSLMVPDYNAGDEACWDTLLCDVVCAGPVN